jgi:hypothetical protein
LVAWGNRAFGHALFGSEGGAAMPALPSPIPISPEVPVIARRSVAPLALVLLSLAGCAGTDISPDAAGAPSPTPSASASSEPSAVPSPTPGSTETASPVALPADCEDIVSAEAYAAVFGSTPLNPENFPTRSGGPRGRITPTTPPAGATPEEVVQSATTLDCLWRDPNADITGIEVLMATVNPAVGAAYLAELADEGYSCEDAHDGRRCHITRPNPDHPEADEGYTRFLRDGVVISVNQVNFSTDDLLGDIVDRIWG